MMYISSKGSRRAGLLAALLALHGPTPPPLPAQQAIAIPAPDGPPIAADVYGAGSRAVVLAHGGRFDRTSWREQAEALAGAGFLVLAIDFRAAVLSRAGNETGCLYDPTCLATDVLAAVRHLRQEGARFVAVVGGSLGGGAAAQASVDAAPGEIDRVVMLAHMPIDHPERMKGRKLFVISRDDLGSGDVPRLPAIREQYEKASQPKELVVLDGSAHAQFIFATAAGDRLLALIKRFLSEPQAPPPPAGVVRSGREQAHCGNSRRISDASCADRR